jgi:hypothetical protein
LRGDYRTINPELQRFLAKRMGAKTIEIPAIHLSLISHPRKVAELILEAAGQMAERFVGFHRAYGYP